MKRLFALFLTLTVVLLASAQPKPIPKPVVKQDTPAKKPAPKRPSSRSSAKQRASVIQNLVNNMVRVPGGTFTMGATSEQGDVASDGERPAHSVTLSSYSIGRYEVTQEEWQAVMGSNPSSFKGDKRPVENVSYEDICGSDGTGTNPSCFFYKLRQMTGLQFRLPTEAEWEYAARGGQSGGTKYSGSNSLDNVGWYTDNSSNTTHPVGQKSPNALGLYDMSGNVWEWCSDWYGSYSSSAQTNPQGPSSGQYRVGRGGSWLNDARFCRVSYRCYCSPDSRIDSLGFRLAL